MGMGNKFTQQCKRLKSSAQTEHLDFKSERHKVDRVAGHEKISRKFIRVEIESDPKEPAEFFGREGDTPQEREKFAEKFSGTFMVQHEGEKKGKALVISQKKFYALDAQAKADSKFYWRKATGKNKDGTPKRQRQKAEGFWNASFGFTPWVSQALAEWAGRDEKSFKDAKNCALSMANSARFTFEKRTGYKVVSVVLHPTSNQNLHIHINFQTCSGGKLLGRSATGKRGRKGLRFLGWVNLAMYNMSKRGKLIVSPEKQLAQDTDDKAISDVFDKAFAHYAPIDVQRRADELAKEHVYKWNTKIFEKTYVPRYSEKRTEDLHRKLLALDPGNPVLLGAMGYDQDENPLIVGGGKIVPTGRILDHENLPEGFEVFEEKDIGLDSSSKDDLGKDTDQSSLDL